MILLLHLSGVEVHYSLRVLKNGQQSVQQKKGKEPAESKPRMRPFRLTVAQKDVDPPSEEKEEEKSYKLNEKSFWVTEKIGITTETQRHVVKTPNVVNIVNLAG